MSKESSSLRSSQECPSVPVPGLSFPLLFSPLFCFFSSLLLSWDALAAISTEQHAPQQAQACSPVSPTGLSCFFILIIEYLFFFALVSKLPFFLEKKTEQHGKQEARSCSPFSPSGIFFSLVFSLFLIVFWSDEANKLHPAAQQAPPSSILQSTCVLFYFFVLCNISAFPAFLFLFVGSSSSSSSSSSRQRPDYMPCAPRDESIINTLRSLMPGMLWCTTLLFLWFCFGLDIDPETMKVAYPLGDVFALYKKHDSRDAGDRELAAVPPHLLFLSSLFVSFLSTSAVFL